jgi:hypothetical protein
MGWLVLVALLLVGPVLAADRVATMIVPNAPGTSLVASRVISTRSCKLYAVIVLNTSASLQYVQIHETTSLPANGVAPKIPSIPVSPGSVVMIDVGGTVGLDLDALTICNSSTAATKTIGSADCMISAVLAAD